MPKRTSTMKHDALNHLNAIVLGLQVLNDRDADDCARQHLRMIERAVADLKDLILATSDALATQTPCAPAVPAPSHQDVRFANRFAVGGSFDGWLHPDPNSG